MLELRFGKALAHFVVYPTLLVARRESLLVFYIPSLLPSIELVLEMPLWLDVMFGLGLLSHVRRPPGLGQGHGLWGINLT